jgi:hypothetical protein
MRTSIKLLQLIEMIIVVLVPLVGCNLPVGTPMPSTGPGPLGGPGMPLTPPGQLGQPGGSNQPGQPDQPTLPAGQEVFRFIKTVQVTPDEVFGGGGGFIHYVPATDRLVAVVSVKVPEPVKLDTGMTCEADAVAYKEYTTDLQPTGNYGYLSCVLGDNSTRMIGNDLYHVKGGSEGGKPGLYLEKFDAVTWKRSAVVFIPLERPHEMDDGPMIALINGQIDVTGPYYVGETPGAARERGTHHHFFTTNLEPLGKKILAQPQYPWHCPPVTMIQEPNGDILMFASDDYPGNLIVLRFDKDWNFIDQRTLRDNAFFPTGSVSDGGRYYVAYTDTRKSKPPMLVRNVGLAAFDADWNLLQDVLLTDFDNTNSPQIDADNPWVMLHGNRLYVSYSKVTMKPSGDGVQGAQMFVNIYELSRAPE